MLKKFLYSAVFLTLLGAGMYAGTDGWCNYYNYVKTSTYNANNTVVGTSTGTLRTDLNTEISSRTTQGLYRYAGIKAMPTYFQTGPTTVNVKSDGVFAAFTNPSGYTGVTHFSCAESTFTLTDNLASYFIYADYNNGAPLYRMSEDNNDINTLTTIAVLTCVRIGTDPDSIDFIEWTGSGNGLPEKLNDRFVRTSRFQRESSGLILGVIGTTVTATSAYVWHGDVRQLYPAFDSSVDSLASLVHVAGVWTEFSRSTLNTERYDDGVSTRALAAGTYGYSDFFRCMANDVEVYAIKSSTGYATVAEAAAVNVTSNLPARVVAQGLYIGRIVYLAGATSGLTVYSSFLGFTPGQSSPTDHDNLTGLQGGSAGTVLSSDPG